MEYSERMWKIPFEVRTGIVPKPKSEEDDWNVIIQVSVITVLRKHNMSLIKSVNIT